MNRTIILTGANGQLGRSLYQELSPFYNVIPFIYHKPFSKKFFQNSAIQIDITDYLSLKNIVKTISPDIIINSAAYTNVDLCEKNKNKARNVNVNGVENLLKSSNIYTKFIQISTDYVFDGKKGGYVENDATLPLSYYGKTKLESENILRGSNRQWMILRPNVLYGNDFKLTASFVSWVYNNLKAEKEINVVEDQINNPSWTTAVSQAIRQSIIMGAEGIFHYGSHDIITRYEFANIIAEIFNLDKNLIHKTTTKNLKQNAIRPMNSSLNINKITNEVGAQAYSTEYCLRQIHKLLETI